MKGMQEIFRVERTDDSFNPDKLGNRRLLWHGSRLTNFKGIFEEGLLIAPEHVPHTAFLFGKGLYFADMFAKAASYCKAQ
jgi:hypothetical protein